MCPPVATTRNTSSSMFHVTLTSELIRALLVCLTSFTEKISGVSLILVSTTHRRGSFCEDTTRSSVPFHSTLQGSEGGSPSCFVDSDVVRRHLVRESSPSASPCNQPSLRRHASSTCICQSACREMKREHCFPQLVMGKNREVGNHAVLDR